MKTIISISERYAPNLIIRGISVNNADLALFGGERENPLPQLLVESKQAAGILAD